MWQTISVGIKKFRIVFFIVSIAMMPAMHLGAQDLSSLKGQKPIKLSSGLSFNMGGYTAQGISNRRMPFTWSLQGTPVLDIYGVRLPFLISFSNQQRSFHQPFNQFGVAPSYKWIKLHLGYSNVRFSNYTLAGRRFLGAGVELTPHNWRIGFVAGRFQKAIEFDSTAVRQSGIYPVNVPVPAFTRNGYAAKLGYGSRKTYVEVTLLKAKDNELSIDESYKQLRTLRPEENTVIGLNTQVTLMKNLIWNMELAGSAYTRDLRSDTLDMEKYPAIHTFNSVMTPRKSTQVFTAGETSLAFNSKLFGIQGRYRRVDPDFKSMGAYFFETDFEQFTISPSLRLFRSKLVLNGSIGLQKNNLSNARIHTTERLIKSISGAFNPSTKAGVSFSISNFGVTQLPNPNLSSIPTYDTLRLAQVARSINVSPYLRFGNTQVRQTITLSVNHNQISSGPNSDASAQAAMQTIGGNIQYVFSDIRKKLNVQLGLNYQQVENIILSTTTRGINAGAGKTWQDFTLSGNVAVFQNLRKEQAGGSTFQCGINTRYKLRNGFTWNTRIGMIKASNGLMADFTEWYGNTGIHMRF